ncbi:MAG TPA: hypothetical protein VMT15_17800 [Bryobacteraceae bacterium]|nr:hypothetical protein [Bryobacteraceae bacterium]
MTPALTSDRASAAPSENVLPMLAHEIRQPLGAIEALAYYMALLHGKDAKQREQLTRIQRLVEYSNWILSSSLALADPRPVAPIAADLEELILHVMSVRSVPTDPPLNLVLAPDLPLVRLDPAFGRVLIETLLGLFRQLATPAHPATLRAAATAGGVELELSTAAPGYRSTGALPPGSGLSLDCAGRIAAMHGGSVDYSVDPLSGIRVRVMLP